MTKAKEAAEKWAASMNPRNQADYEKDAEAFLAGWKARGKVDANGYARGIADAAKLISGDARFVTEEFYGSDFQDAREQCADAIRALGEGVGNDKSD